MMRQKMEAELEQMQNEASRILAHFGGALSLVEPDSIEE
jgi:hypothetical protein